MDRGYQVNNNKTHNWVEQFISISYFGYNITARTNTKVNKFLYNGTLPLSIPRPRKTRAAQ